MNIQVELVDYVVSHFCIFCLGGALVCAIWLVQNEKEAKAAAKEDEEREA